MRISKKSLLLTLLLFFASLPAWAQMGARLMDMNDSGEMKSLFNNEKGKVRLIAILSPT